MPIRIRLDDAPETTTSDSIAGFPRYALKGRVENATSAVRGDDGSCLPSLASQGSRNPLLDANGGDRITVQRHPNMHGGHDDVFTLDWPTGVSGTNSMGSGLFISTSALIQAATPTLTTADTVPHGAPFSGPITSLKVVSGGRRKLHSVSLGAHARVRHRRVLATRVQHRRRVVRRRQ